MDGVFQGPLPRKFITSDRRDTDRPNVNSRF